ncbi:MAG: 2-oxoacid:acceptor oxidoreductase family protein [Candidatus Nanoarchaeia archaeon]|nr:2-oxoacid:acceptor oxidoreductase family protein [Candidatus Nanoarchaeia archaeon]MDD5587541.1 2-oxoacid:acceptor oxidoreductase family protein [Candidatus Nanoarchaeia archaeon]
MKSDIIITGYGGQGVLTIAEVIAKAALSQGYNISQTELHGLAQRGGSLQCHIRISDKKINSELILVGSADLIIALDPLEALRACYWANPNTTILINYKTSKPYLVEELSPESLITKIKKFSKKIEIVKADDIVEKLTGNIMDANTYILGYALKKNILILNKDKIWKSITDKIRPEFIESNKKVFNEALK